MSFCIFLSQPLWKTAAKIFWSRSQSRFYVGYSFFRISLKYSLPRFYDFAPLCRLLMERAILLANFPRYYHWNKRQFCQNDLKWHLWLRYKGFFWLVLHLPVHFHSRPVRPTTWKTVAQKNRYLVAYAPPRTYAVKFRAWSKRWSNSGCHPICWH